jgi:hypothetical protein
MIAVIFEVVPKSSSSQAYLDIAAHRAPQVAGWETLFADCRRAQIPDDFRRR